MATRVVETWAAEQALKTLLSADLALAAAVGSKFYEGAWHAGVSTRLSGTVPACVFRRAADISGLGGSEGAARKLKDTEIGFVNLEYEVVIMAATESYRDPLSSAAELVFGVLHDVETTVGAHSVRFEVIGPYAARDHRAGKLWKELGWRVRATVWLTAAAYFPSSAVYIAFGTAASEIDLSGMVEVAQADAELDAGGGLVHTVQLGGIWTSTGGSLNTIAQMIGIAGKSVIYGPQGNTGGYPKWTNLNCKLSQFYIYHADGSLIRWSAAIQHAAWIYATF